SGGLRRSRLPSESTCLSRGAFTGIAATLPTRHNSQGTAFPMHSERSGAAIEGGRWSPGIGALPANSDHTEAERDMGERRTRPTVKKPKTRDHGKRLHCAKCRKRSLRKVTQPAPWYCPACLK